MDNDWTKDDFKDPQRPGLDVTSLDVDGARRQSRNCPFCNGSGFATIFRPSYTGNPIMEDVAPDGAYRRQLLRSVAYCSCVAGSKISEMHRQHAKDVFARIPFYADIATKPSEWLVDDPSIGELPEAIRDLKPAQALRWFLARANRITHRREIQPDVRAAMTQSRQRHDGGETDFSD